ncbi:MAG: flippase [Bacilli bacterium]|nr:flippase [Bacilli bacterium]
MAKKSIAENYVYNLLYQILSIITPLVTTPYLTRVLGAENLGIHGYTLSIVTYFILFGSLGISMYGQREIAYVQDDKNKRSNVFFELLFLRFITYIISFAVYFLFFCINDKYNIFYKILIIEMLANAIDIAWYFQGIEEFRSTVVRNLIVKVLGLISIFIFVKSYNDLVIYFVLYVLCDFIGNLSLWGYLKNQVKLNMKKLHIKRHIIPMILLFLPQVAVQIYTVLDKTMVGNITKNMGEVGYYDQAQKLVRALLLIVTALGLVMNSRIANSHSKNDKESIKYYMLQSISMVWLISMPLIMGILAVSDKFIPWYLGEGFNDVIPLICATAPILLAIGLNNVTGVQYLIQVGKQNVFTISVIIGALVNVVLNFVLINKIGTIGAVYSSVLAEFVILIVHLIYLRKKISVIDIIKPGIKNIIAATIMFFIVRYITIKLPISVFNTLSEIVLGAIIYLLMLYIQKDDFSLGIIKKVFKVLLSKMKVAK